MQHFFEHVPGFMSGKNTVLFDHVIKTFPPGGTWVELGSWLGRSTAYCVVELINQEKLGSFYCVDTWDGGEEHKGWKELPTLQQDFQRNLAPIKDQIKMIVSDSWTAADQFDNESVDFCYVDAGHTYECVMRDLESWWTKIRPGAYFGGDDYTKGWPGVQRAVWDFFRPKNIRVIRMGRCWQVLKP
jgi:hypothetical protein